MQPFQAEQVERSAGSWARGTKFALATGLSSLCNARGKIRRGKLNLHMWDAWYTVCESRAYP